MVNPKNIEWHSSLSEIYYLEGQGITFFLLKVFIKVIDFIFVFFFQVSSEIFSKLGQVLFATYVVPNELRDCLIIKVASETIWKIMQ